MCPPPAGPSIQAAAGGMLVRVLVLELWMVVLTLAPAGLACPCRCTGAEVVAEVIGHVV